MEGKKESLKKQSSKTNLSSQIFQRQNSQKSARMEKTLASKDQKNASLDKETSKEDRNCPRIEKHTIANTGDNPGVSNGEPVGRNTQTGERKVDRSLRKLRGSVHTIQVLALLSMVCIYSPVLDYNEPLCFGP